MRDLGRPRDLLHVLARARERETRVWARLRRISASIAAGQGSTFPTFFVWHRPDLSEFVVCRLEDWAAGSRKALGLGRQAFAELIKNLPGWEGELASTPRRDCALWETVP